MADIGHNSGQPAPPLHGGGEGYGSDGRFSAERLALRERELGMAWSDLDAAEKLLSGVTKSLLAKLTNEIRLDSPEKLSRREAQDLAEGSEEYVEHLRSAVQAALAKNKARVAYDAMKSFCRLLQTSEVSRRAEMGIR